MPPTNEETQAQYLGPPRLIDVLTETELADINTELQYKVNPINLNKPIKDLTVLELRQMSLLLIRYTYPGEKMPRVQNLPTEALRIITDRCRVKDLSIFS